jgi:protein gp37
MPETAKPLAMKDTKIEWCDSTFNAWSGCTKVSPACAHCYAKAMAKRAPKTLGQWGPGAPRRRTSEAYWQQPYRWNAEAPEFASCPCGFTGTIPFESSRCPKCDNTDITYRRRRVFLNSMSDWLDDEVPIEWLADVLNLIRRTPNLDWLLLTKRPQNWRSRMGAALRHLTEKQSATATPRSVSDDEADALNWIDAWLRDDGVDPIPANVWIGTTVEDQQCADERIPQLLAIPARVRFLSCEPLLGPVLLDFDSVYVNPASPAHGIHWVIAGGESGPKARPMHPAWARSIRDQCVAAGVPFFFKQWGEWQPLSTVDGRQVLPFGHYILPTHINPGFGFSRVGKKAAGRVLDGKEWSEFPHPQS